MPLRCLRCWIVLLMALLVAGCTSGKKKKQVTEDEVREAFKSLQEALGELREGDINKLWDALCNDTREDADKFAKALSAQLAKKSPEELADLADEYKVAPEELKKKMTGRRYIQLTRAKLYKKYFLALSAPMDHFTYKDGELKVFYKGEDDKNETKDIIFVREDKQWKAVLNLSSRGDG